MRNRYIELERFVASTLVLLYHLGVSKGSWIFVEFFFMLTGYFTIAHIERKRETIIENTWYPVSYTWKKFTKILPYTGISILILFVYQAIEWNLSIGDFFKWLLRLPLELMMLAGSGMLPNGFQIAEGIHTSRIMNYHLWYICSMLFVLPIVVYLLTYIKKAKSILLTILPMFLYGILIMKDGTVDGWHDPDFAFVFCNVRAMAGILLGAAAYYFSQWWNQRQYTRLGKILLTLLEVVSFLLVSVLSYVTTLRYDALFIGLFFVSISLSNAGVTYTVKIKNALLDFLGAISLPIYCLQMPVIEICSNWLDISNPWMIFIITILLSVLLEIVLRGMKKIKFTFKNSLII